MATLSIKCNSNLIFTKNFTTINIETENKEVSIEVNGIIKDETQIKLRDETNNNITDYKLYLDNDEIQFIKIISSNTINVIFEENVFKYCTKLQKIVFLTDLKGLEIKKSAFDGTGLKVLSLKQASTLTELRIEDSAFQNSDIQKIELPESITILEINNNAFMGCLYLTEFVIPKNVTTLKLGISIFENCMSMNIFKIHDNIKYLINITDGKQNYLPDFMFLNCVNLITVYISLNLFLNNFIIGTNTFKNCKEFIGIDTSDIIMNMLSKNKELLNTNETLEEAVTNLKSDIKLNKENINILTEENKTLKHQTIILETSNSNYIEQLNTNKNDKIIIENKVTELTNQSNLLKNEKIQINEQLNILKNEKIQINEQLNILKNEITQTDNKLTELKTENKHLDNVVIDLKEQIKTREIEYNKLYDNYEEMSSKKKDVDNLLKLSNIEITSITKKNNELSNKNNVYDMKINMLQKENNRMNKLIKSGMEQIKYIYKPNTPIPNNPSLIKRYCTIL
jgi:hypothetical protein